MMAGPAAIRESVGGPGASADYLERPVFLCGHRKSGTTLLVCLLDSHPELLTFPCDSGFFYKVFPACQGGSREQAIDSLIDHTIRHCLTKEMTNVGRPDLFDIDAIAQRFREIAAPSDGSPSSLLKALIGAYAEGCGQDPSRWTSWVEKTTSNEIYALEIAAWFPRAKFVHLIRDPRDNFASLKSGWQARYRFQEDEPKALLQSLLDRAGLGARLADHNRAALGADRYMILRFEDLMDAPEPHLRDMAAFMGIDYHPSLLAPTVNGIAWPGNNFDGQKFQGVSAANVGRWRERIEPEEVAVIEFFMADIMERFGYQPVTSDAEKARAAAEHYKWFNISTRGGGIRR